MSCKSHSPSESIEMNFCNDFAKKHRRLLYSKSLINPIAEQAIAKIREKIENKFFPNAFKDSLKENWFEAAEAGDLAKFERLYSMNSSRIRYKDSRGKSALHYATARNHVSIIEFIIAHEGDINAQDENGDTALHYAVKNDAVEGLSCLLKNDANVSILNHDMNGPIHIAVILNKVNILEEMVKFKGKVDTKLRGKHGRTALHFTAIHDHAECAQILLSQLRCCPKTPCDYGFYPIHEAAKNASANTLQAILEWGEKSLGYGREMMMKFFDAEGNVPLHSAVHAGDIKAVSLCLNSGAVISTQQHDLSTPVHLACSQGAIDIVKLMFQSQPEEKANCLSICDAQKFTPLHCAASFDHADLVKYLVKQGANMSATDKEGRNVLLLAGARAAWRSVNILIELGASVTEIDNCNRNILHHIVISGGKLDHFTEQISKSTYDPIDALLNERDLFGCSPLHYASRDGHFKTIQSLLQLGAVINLKNNENQSALHFAARYGRFNTAKHLLESCKGHLIINEMDGEGMTSLHISSQSGHTRIVRLLLIKGALLHRDHKGRTPLHLASANGHTDTMQQLLLVHSHLLDQVDRDGNSALALAAINNKASAASILLSLECKILKNNEGMSPIDYALHFKHSEVAMAMVMHPTRDDEIMRCRLKKYNCLLEGLTANMPEVMNAVLDKGITKSKLNEDCKSYYIKYNFRYLQDAERLVPFEKPLPVMNLMVLYDREELLSHPLCVKYLETKWSSYGMYFHLLNLAIYVIFLTFLTINAIKLMDTKNNLMRFNRNNSTNNSQNDNEWRKIDVMYEDSASLETSKILFVTSSIVLVFVILNIIKEFCQMYQQRTKYFTDVINVLEWILYISSGFMSFGYLTQKFHPTSLYIAAAIAVFMAWFNLLIYMQRFNRAGIYVVMFLEILSTLVKVIFVFSVLIIAFGLSFFILLTKIDTIWNEEKGFHHPTISMIRVGTMMLGEIDFLGTFLRPLQLIKDPSNYIKYQLIAALCFLIMFAVLMPILLMNLLIGLAVGDIETVRRNAQLKRLTMQVELHTDLERKLPKQFLKFVDKMEVFEYPNRKCKHTSYVWSTFQRWFASPNSSQQKQQIVEFKTSSIALQQNIEHNRMNEDISGQLTQHRKRLRELSKASEQQLELLRLIVQKMEIQTENDEDYDEGDSCGFDGSLKRIANLPKFQ